MDTSRFIITLGREFGSGGHDVGKRLAEKLGVAFYDKEILARAARDSGICEELFEHHDERKSPSYLFSLVATPGYGEPGPYAPDLPLNHRIFMAQFEAISQLALEGPCVIVGRCADYVLRDQPNVARLFLYGSQSARIDRIMRVRGLPADKAKELIRKTDKQRQSYYNFFAEGNWGQRCNYDLMLNTDGLTEDAAADAIIAYLRGRADETKGD